MQWFPDQKEREEYVHCLGNLVLLSHKKNSQAQNYDFLKKKKLYFQTSGGVSPFALTTQVLQYDEWRPDVVDMQQRELIQRLKDMWRLG
jgi:hypothetical protein